MGRAAKGRIRGLSAASAAALAAAVWTGCLAATPPSQLDERRERLTAEIDEVGLSDDPAVDAAQERLEAAIASERGAVAFDGFELRASVANEIHDTVEALARLPIANPLEITAEREARRAGTEVAFAELEAVKREQQSVLCVPSVRKLVLEERLVIFEDYAQRHQGLLEWNRELGRAGLLDEVRVSRFELASRVRLATRDPSSMPSPLLAMETGWMRDALPPIAPGAPLLPTDREVLREHLLLHQPAVHVQRANRRHLEALARTESAKRIPSLRFVDVGFEPVIEPGATRSWTARVAVDVPLGRAASANRDRYEALARAAHSGERELVERRVQEAWFAIEEINAFRRDAERWRELELLADESENVAERWWRNRLADPSQISNLLDTVHDARMAVLDARERAGLAGCTLTAATGLAVSEWP